MATDLDIIQDYNEIYRYETQQWSPYWDEAFKDLRYYLGDQWEYGEKAFLEANYRNALVFNKIRRLLHMLTGLERKNRLNLTVKPVEGTDDKTASQFTGVMAYDMKRIYPEIGRTFLGASKVGINLCRLVVNYDEDLLSGDIGAMRYAFNQFILDSNFTRPDLKDCQHILTRRYVHRDAAKALLPDKAKELEEIEVKGMDDKFDLFYNPFRWDKEDTLRYDEFWRRSNQKVKVIIDTLTGKYLIWKKEAKEDFRALMDVKIKTRDKGMVPRFIARDRYIPTVDYYVIIENELFFRGKDPTNLDDYPFEAEIAYYDPEYTDLSWKLQGVIRCMRDPQTEVNRRRSKLIDLIDSQISSGWEVEENSTPEGYDEQYYQSGQAKVIYKKEGKLDRSKKIDPPQIPAGFFQAAQMMDNDIEEIPGGNSELFGMAEDGQKDIAGVLAKLRSNAGLVAFQSLFDDHRDLLPRLGRKLIKIEQQNYHPTKVQRILNEVPTETFYDEFFSKYDCVATEGLLTDTQRQLYYLQLKELKAEGAPIPWTELIEACPIEMKDRLKKAIEQAEKAQGAAAKGQQTLDTLTQMMMQAKINNDNASARAKTSQVDHDKLLKILEALKVAHELEDSKDQRLFNWLDYITGLSGSGGAPQGAGAGQDLMVRR